MFREHGDRVSMNKVELGAGEVVLVGLAFLEGVEEGILGLGVFGEDVGEAMAAFVVVVGVTWGAVVDADPAGVFAVEGFGLEATFLGKEVGDGTFGAGFIGTGVGGEFGLVVGAVLVA